MKTAQMGVFEGWERGAYNPLSSFDDLLKVLFFAAVQLEFQTVQP